MASFSAKIKTPRGVETTEIAANSLEEAKRIALRRGTVIALKRTRDFSSGKKLTQTDRMIFLQRLAAMLASKVGTSEALTLLRDTFKGSISRVSGIMLRRIEAGSNLAEAMEFAGRSYFPDAVVAIIRTGSQGGNTPMAIKEAIRFEHEMSKARKESAKGLWSAIFGFVAGVITLMVSIYYVAPKVIGSELMRSAQGVDIDWVMTMAHSLAWVAWVFIGFVGMLLFISHVYRPIAPAQADRLIMKIPLFKDIVLSRNNFIALYGLSVLVKTGVRMEDALRLSYESAPRGEMREDFRRALDAVRRGRPWPRAMRTLLPTDQAALSVSEDRATIANALSELAEQYRSLYGLRMGKIVPAFAVFSAVFLSFAGFVMFAVVVIPMMQMVHSIITTL